MITYICDVDMTPGGRRPILHLSQYDSDYEIVFRLMTTSGIFELESGTTAQIRGTKPDGNGYSATAAVDVNAATVTVTGDVQMTAAAGKCVYEITLKKGNKELSTINCYVEIERAALDKGTISASQIREFVYVYDRIDELKSAARTITHSIDPTLKITGRAADAGATGAAVDNLQEQVDTLNAQGIIISEDVVSQAVQDWLDDHPTSTTTVKDGSLTDVKWEPAERKRRMLFFNTLQDLKDAAAGLITGQWVHVFGECYPQYDGKDLDFQITDTYNFYAISLGDGKYAEPYCEYMSTVPYSPEAAYNIIKTGLSYFDRSALVYPPKEDTVYGGMFADNITQYQDGTKPIDCSTFVQACLMGIPYENSKYIPENDVNFQQPWGFRFPSGLPVSDLQPERTKGYSASELAFYAYLHGWLYKIAEDGGNVCPGDIVFDAHVEKRLNEFNQIGHVQIVFDTISPLDNGIRCIEAGQGDYGVGKYSTNVVKIRSYVAGKTADPDKKAGIYWGARFPVQATAKFEDITSEFTRNISYPFTLNVDAEHDQTTMAGVLFAKENFQVGELYTLVVRGELDKIQSAWYPFVRLTNVYGSIAYNAASFVGTMDRGTKEMCFAFCRLRDQEPVTPANALKLGINNSDSQGTLSVQIDDMRIYRGLYIGEQEEKPSVNLTWSSGVTVNQCKIAGSRIIADIVVPISAFGDKVIATSDLYMYAAQAPVRQQPVSVTHVNGSGTTDGAITAQVRYNENSLTLRVMGTGTAPTSVHIRFDFDIAA